MIAINLSTLTNEIRTTYFEVILVNNYMRRER